MDTSKEKPADQPKNCHFDISSVAPDILDYVTDYVYITDNVTKTIVYINVPLKKALGVQSLPKQAKCYSVLRGRKTPCPHCSNNNCLGDGFHISHNNLKFMEDVYVAKAASFVTNEKSYSINLAKPKKDILENIADLSRKGTDVQILARLLQVYSRHMESPNLQMFEIFSIIGELLQACSISVYENRKIDFSENSGFQRSLFWTSDDNLDITDDQKKDIPEQIVSAAFDDNYPLYLTASDPAHPQLSELMGARGISRICAIPLCLNHEILGNLFIREYTPKLMQQYQYALEVTLTLVAQVVLHRRTCYELDNIHNEDELTRLKNRSAMLRDAGNMSMVSHVGVLSVNINNLKQINADFGEKEGDRALIKTAGLLRQLLHNNEYIYRVSGDEFLCLFPGISEADFRVVSDTVTAFLGNKNSLSAAVGARWTDSGKEIFTAIAEAGQNMIQNKKEFYRQHPAPLTDPGSVMDILTPVHIENLLADGSFRVYYQPKFGLKNNSYSGAEALIRLSLNNVMIPPSDFIPALDSAHFTHLVDLFVLDSVCKTLRDRLDKGLPVLPVSCNFSRHTIVRPDFLNRVREIMDKYHINHNLTPIEVSERSDTVYHTDLINATVALARKGFCISLDDFGVAHANMKALVDLPVSELKFDKMLIDTLAQHENIKIRAILSYMISMCQHMHIKTTAEGVETKAQSEVLRELGCDEIQGYLYSRPVPEQEYYNLVDGRA